MPSVSSTAQRILDAIHSTSSGAGGLPIRPPVLTLPTPTIYTYDDVVATSTGNTDSVARRILDAITNTTAQRILDAINSVSSSSGAATSTPATPPATGTGGTAAPVNLICSTLSDDTLGVNLSAPACTTSTARIPRLVIVNDLNVYTDGSGVRYQNQLIRAVKYSNVTSAYASVSGSGATALNALLELGADFVYDSAEPYCGPNAYPPVVAPGARASYSVYDALTRAATYDVGFVIGRWDAGFTEGCWYRGQQGVIKCDGSVINKIRFIRINHPAGKDVTVYLSRFFPDYAYSGVNWCSAMGSGSGATGSGSAGAGAGLGGVGAI